MYVGRAFIGPTETVAFFVFLAAAGAAVVLYDRVLLLLYQQDRIGWALEGRPPGFLWSPPDAAKPRAVRVTITAIRWLFRPPRVATPPTPVQTVYRLYLSASLLAVAAFGVLGLRIYAALF